MPKQNSQTLQSAAAATGNGGSLNVGGFSSVAVQLSGTFVATVTFEVSLDNSNWVAVPATNLATGATATTATATGMYVTSVSAYAYFRARISAYTSGSVTAFAVASEEASDNSLALMNAEVVAFASAVRTATQTSGDFLNLYHSGATFFFNVIASPGVDTVQLIVDAKDPAGTGYRALLTAAATANTGLQVYQIGLGAAAAGSLSTATSVGLPRTFRIRVVHSAATNFTYTVGFCLH